MAGVADIPDKDVTTETVQAGKRDTAWFPPGVAQLAAFTPTWEGVARCARQTPGSQGACAHALGHTSLPRDEPEAPSHTCSPPISTLLWPSHLHLCCPACVCSPAAPSHPSLSPSPGVSSLPLPPDRSASVCWTGRVQNMNRRGRGITGSRAHPSTQGQGWREPGNPHLRHLPGGPWEGGGASGRFQEQQEMGGPRPIPSC